MQKSELIEIGLTEEQAGKVLEGFKTFIPKARFDEVNEAKKTAEELVKERDGQIEGLKTASGNIEELKGKIESLQSANVEAGEKYKAEIAGIKLMSAVDKALANAKAKNVKMVKALLNMESIKMDGENIIGLDDQIKTLKADPNSMFAFQPEGEPKAEVKGGHQPGDGQTVPKEPKSYLDFVALEK